MDKKFDVGRFLLVWSFCEMIGALFIGGIINIIIPLDQPLLTRDLLRILFYFVSMTGLAVFIAAATVGK